MEANAGHMQPELQWFVVPPTLQPFVNELQSIVFYRPKAGHQLAADATYAVRLNEAYTDVKAALENERAYVRAAALKAGRIVFYPCIGKNPVMVLSGFEEKPIREGNRAMEAAVGRAVTVRPQKAHRLETAMTHDTVFVRVCGQQALISKLAKHAASHGRPIDVKQHHVEGAFFANLHVHPEKLTAKITSKMCVTYVQDITSSVNAEYQLTMRRHGATAEETIEIGTHIQVIGGRTHLRTHGTLRATMPQKVTADVVASLRASYPEWSIYTDTPTNVWASAPAHPTTAKPKTAPIPDVTAAVQCGHQVFKIQADYTPSPQSFQAIANALQGQLIHVVEAKFTDAPMSCFISLPASADVSSLAAPFAIDDWGHWYASPVRGPKTSK
jgi:hypothetical protein